MMGHVSVHGSRRGGIAHQAKAYSRYRLGSSNLRAQAFYAIRLLGVGMRTNCSRSEDCMRRNHMLERSSPHVASDYSIVI